MGGGLITSCPRDVEMTWAENRAKTRVQVHTLILLLTTLLPLLYGLAEANYLVYFLRLEPFAQRTCTRFLFGTFMVHVGYLLLRAMHYQRHPIVGTAELL